MTDAPIVATKDRPGSYDAIESAKPGEPLFPIQGGDLFGPPTVLHWAKLCREAGLASEKPKEAERLLRKAMDAEQVAWAMLAYQRGQEPIEGERAYYSDSGTAETADERRTQREALIRSARKLHGLSADGLEVAETLARFRAHPEEEAAVREAVAVLKQAAFLIEPRRGSERS